MRSVIFKRDHGVCSLCGLDAHKAEHNVLIKTMGSVSYRPQKIRSFSQDYSLKELAYRAECARLGFKPHRSFWEADHIVPHCEGGTCEMSNLRTLCQPCHVKVTRVSGFGSIRYGEEK